MKAPTAEIRRATIRAVITLGTPIVLSNLLTWAVGFTDIYMVSRLGETELAGLGMATQIFFLVVVLILAVTTGTMALVARFSGAGDAAMTSHVIRQSLLLSVAQAAVIGVAGLLVAPTLFRLLGATPEVAAVGVVYLRILFIGIAAPVLDFNFASIFRGAGDSLTPLRITFWVVVLNIIGNYLLIFGPGPLPALGIAGAATATVLARGIGAAWGWHKLKSATSGIHWVPGSWAPDRTMMRRILRIGVPTAFEGFLRAGSGVAFLGIVARTGAGATAVAAHTVGLQLESFARMPAFAISVGATALVGQRLGAEDPDGAEAGRLDVTPGRRCAADALRSPPLRARRTRGRALLERSGDDRAFGPVPADPRRGAAALHGRRGARRRAEGGRRYQVPHVGLLLRRLGLPPSHRLLLRGDDGLRAGSRLARPGRELCDLGDPVGDAIPWRKMAHDGCLTRGVRCSS